MIWVRPHYIIFYLTLQKICSVFVLTIANAALIFGQYNDYAYVMQGLYGSFFGIIAGPIGIRLSYVNQVHQMKRSWSAFVILVCNRTFIYQLAQQDSYRLHFNHF